MHDRISQCECSYRHARKTIRHWDDPAFGSPEISPHSQASPERVHGGSLSQSSGPGRGTTVRGRGTGESGVRFAALAGPKVRLAGDGDSGAGLMRCGRARSSSPARPWTSLAICCRAGSRGGTRQTPRRGPPLVSGRARSTGSAAPDPPGARGGGVARRRTCPRRPRPSATAEVRPPGNQRAVDL